MDRKSAPNDGRGPEKNTSVTSPPKSHAVYPGYQVCSSGEATPLGYTTSLTSDKGCEVADTVPEFDRSAEVSSKTDGYLQAYAESMVAELFGDGPDTESLTEVKRIVYSMHHYMRKQIEHSCKPGEKDKTENAAEILKKLQALKVPLDCVSADTSSQVSGQLPWDAHIRATWKCLSKLVTDSFPAELLDAVLSRSWVTEAERDSIAGKGTPRKQAEELFRVVMLRLHGQVFKDEFLAVLREHSPHLAHLLKEAIKEEEEVGPSSKCLACLFHDYILVKSLAPPLQKSQPIPVYFDLQSQGLPNSTKTTVLMNDVKFDDIMRALKVTCRPLYDQLKQQGVTSLACYCAPGSDSGASDSVANVAELASNPDLDQRERAYNMSSEPRGRCLIIRNSPEFEQDEKNIAFFFEQRKFEVLTHHNLTAGEMKKVLEDQARDDHSAYDIFICFVLSAAREKGIQGLDDSYVNLEDLARKVGACRCPSLAGKPKLFLHQGGRGGRKQAVVVDEEDESKALSDCSDFFLAYSTPAGFSSHSGSGGSAFVSSLLDVLRRHEHEDLLSCMTRVGAELDGGGREKEGGEQWNQVPEFRSSLRKPVFLSQHPTVTEKPGRYRPRVQPEEVAEENSVELRKRSLDATNRRLSGHLLESTSPDILLTRSSSRYSARTEGRPVSTKF